MPIRTVNVVFLESSEEMFRDTDRPVFDVLYNVEGIILKGATHESVWAVADYLVQWDNADLDEREDAAPGAYDDEWDCRIGGTLYTLYANRDLGYVGLNAQIDGPCRHGSRDPHCDDCEAGR